MFVYRNIRNSSTPDPRFLLKICKRYSVRKWEDIKIRPRPTVAHVRIATCLNPKMYQNTTQKHPQNGSRIEEIMENRAPEHSSRSPIDQHATFNTTRGGSGSPEWRTRLDFGTLRSILAPILNTRGPEGPPQIYDFGHKVVQDTINCGNNARHAFWKPNCMQND